MSISFLVSNCSARSRRSPPPSWPRPDRGMVGIVTVRHPLLGQTAELIFAASEGRLYLAVVRSIGGGCHIHDEPVSGIREQLHVIAGYRAPFSVTHDMGFRIGHGRSRHKRIALMLADLLQTFHFLQGRFPDGSSVAVRHGALPWPDACPTAPALRTERSSAPPVPAPEPDACFPASLCAETCCRPHWPLIFVPSCVTCSMVTRPLGAQHAHHLDEQVFPNAAL